MKKLISVAAALTAAFAGCMGPNAGTASDAEKPLRVAVFVGGGARNIGVFRWLELTARAKNVVATPIDGEAVRRGGLDAADVLVMPGGSSVEESKSLGPDGREKVKAFVRNGGCYVGTCAGCCLLMEPSKGHPDMLHMIPFRFGQSGGKADLSVAFNRRAEELAGIPKGCVSLRYAEGPVPLPSLPVKDAEVEVVARYNSDINAKDSKERPSMAGQAAAIAGKYGKGRLFVLSVHPESDEKDHYILKGAFRYVSGRELDWDYPQRKRGQLAVGFMCDDSFGVDTARLVQRLVTEEEFDVIPLNKRLVEEEGMLHNVDAVLAPSGEGSVKLETGLYGDNLARTKAFLARGGRIFAWGRAAEAAQRYESGVTCVADADAALAALRAFADEPVPPPAALPAKVANPIRAGILQNSFSSNIPIARLLALSPEYDLKVLAPEEYAQGALDGLDLVIQPGGGCTKQYNALGEAGAEAIKRFVRAGGKYYGVCAGAFLAMQPSREGYPRLGLIPFKGDDPAHYRGDGPIKITLTDDGVAALDMTNRTCTVIYFGGPAAVPGDPIADTDVKVLAEYTGRIINTKQPEPVEEMVGKAALLGGRVGKGKVFVSCPHPEKQEQTMTLVRRGMKFLTGVEPTPVYLERTRGALTVRYMTSDKASVDYLFGTLHHDRRIHVWPGNHLDELAHSDAVVLTDAVGAKNVKVLTPFLARGGRVVLVCDTPAKQKAAKALKGAIVVKSYDAVVEALLPRSL